MLTKYTSITLKSILKDYHIALYPTHKVIDIREIWGQTYDDTDYLVEWEEIGKL